MILVITTNWVRQKGYRQTHQVTLIYTDFVCGKCVIYTVVKCMSAAY